MFDQYRCSSSSYFTELELVTADNHERLARQSMYASTNRYFLFSAREDCSRPVFGIH